MNEVVSLSMLPVEEATLFREVSKKFITEMPRVVPDQRSKFESDELFRKLSREGEVKYTGFRDRPLEERQLRFQTECREGHADLAFVASGINLQLQFTPNSWSERPEDRVPTRDYVDFEREQGKVHLKSQFILNGVCIIWKGWLDLHRLDGIGSIEFDVERATVEDTLLREQIDQYNRQLRDFEDRQRHYREEQERRAEAEAEDYHRMLRSRAEMLEKSQPLLLLSRNLAKHSLPVLPTEDIIKDSECKKVKKSEPDVELQIPLPMKPVTASSALPIAHTFPGTSTLLSRTGGFVPTLPPASLGMSLSSNLALLHHHTNPRLPVKLYPWKPNMYLV